MPKAHRGAPGPATGGAIPKKRVHSLPWELRSRTHSNNKKKINLQDMLSAVMVSQP